MDDKLKLSYILEFLDAKVSSNCFKEAEAILAAKRLIMCGSKNRTDSEIEIVGSCLQSSQNKGFPHTITGIIRKDGDNWKIQEFNCTCKAGASSSCKHCVAVMLFCHENNLTLLEKLSTTDIECYWKQNKGQFINKIPVPLQDYCHVNAVPNHFLSEGKKRKAIAEIAELLPNSAYVRQKKRHTAWENEENTPIHSRPPAISGGNASPSDLACIIEHILGKECVPNIGCNINLSSMDTSLRNYYQNNVLITKDAAVELAVETKNQNHSRIWAEERQKRITGSICYEVYTYYRNKNPDWNKKIKNVLQSEFRGNVNTAYGLEHESAALNKYAEMCSLKIVKSGFVVHPAYPFLGFSPDGLIIGSDNRIRLLEIKCPVAGITKTATQLVEHLDYLTIDTQSKYVLKDRHKYYGQVQLGLFLLGLDICDLIIYSSSDSSFFKVAVPKDESFLLKMIPCLTDVYFKYVLPTLSE